jgi:hypothetical protein
MSQNSRNLTFSRATLCAVSGIALLVAGSAAVRAEDDTGGDRPYTKFFNKMLGNIGLREQEAGIEYKERPPLVVPPSRDLPQPAAAGSPAAKNAAWPADADGKKRAADRGKPKKDRSVLTDKPDDSATPTSQSDGSGGVWNSVTSFGKTITGNNRESATFVHEPSRNALTDPPAGYRTPAPSQPYGINGLADKAKSKSAIDVQNDTVNGPPGPK